MNKTLAALILSAFAAVAFNANAASHAGAPMKATEPAAKASAPAAKAAAPASAPAEKKHKKAKKAAEAASK